MNLRPHGPEPCALAGLRYAPKPKPLYSPWPDPQVLVVSYQARTSIRSFTLVLVGPLNSSSPNPSKK